MDSVQLHFGKAATPGRPPLAGKLGEGFWRMSVGPALGKADAIHGREVPRPPE